VASLNQKKYFPNIFKKANTLVILFYLCFFILFASGRIASLDAGQQLQASMLFLTTGSLGTTMPPGGFDSGWVLSPNGNYYQPHDIGNVILMLPAAFIGLVTSKLSALAIVENPPVISKVTASLSYACVNAIGCFFIFKLFRSYYKTRTAFLLSLAFPLTTIFGAYTKTAWDVVACCCVNCSLLYYCAQIINGNKVNRNVVLAGLVFGLSCSFRFSLIPFLGISLAFILFLVRRSLHWQNYISCLIAFIVVMIPSFIYNYVRMGSPLRPATTAPQYLEGNNALTGNIVEGFFGLLFSPNRGLFLYSPILLLLFILPFIWNKILVKQRYLLIAFSISSFLYLLLISKLKNWGAFGWGPRYLLPILPFLFFGAGITLIIIWKNHHKVIIGLVLISVILSIPPIFVNWSMAITDFPGALEPSASLPNQQIAVWNGLILGIQGKPLPLPPNIVNDSARITAAKFPDLWTLKLADTSSLGLLVGITISLILLASIIFLFVRLSGVKC